MAEFRLEVKRTEKYVAAPAKNVHNNPLFLKASVNNNAKLD